MTNADSSGWTVAVTHPESGRVKRPDVLDTSDAPIFNPGLNDQPRVRIPVRKDDAWLDPVYDNDPEMQVWRGGDKLPIDVLRDVERDTNRVVLVGVGGIELEERVEKYYDTVRRHVAAENLITGETSYTADVDAPQAASATVDVATLETQSELENNIRIQPTTPLEVTNGQVGVLPSAYLPDTGDFQSNTGTLTTDTGATDETAIEFAGDGAASWAVTTEYDIPVGTDSDAYLAVRARAAGSTNPLSVLATIDGTGVIGGAVGTDTSYTWTLIDITNAEAGDTLSAGNHTIGVSVNDPDTDPDDNVFVDRVVLYDNQYSYTFDNTLDANNQLEGPQRFPDVADVITTDFPSQFAVVGGDATADVDTTDPAARVQLSNDSGATYRPNDGTEQDTDSVSASFADIGSALRARVGLGRYDDGSTDTPTTGNAAQSLNSLTLDADIEQLYLLLDEDRDESIADLLTFLTAETRYLWSYQLDSNGDPKVVFTQPRQRVADDAPEVDKAEIEKEGDTFERVTVKGSPQQVDGERFTASTTFVSLNESAIIGGSESVFDPDTGDQFNRGTDYELDRETGEIRATTESALVAGDEYAISYRTEIKGTYTADDAGANPRELVREVPGVTTTQQAEQAAFVLVDDLSTPRYAGSIRIPRSEQGFDPTEAVPLEGFGLPDVAIPLEVEADPELTERGLQLRLGTRSPVEEALSRVRSQLNAVSKRS